MAVPVPLINGDYPSFADIEISIFSGLYAGIKSINYGHKLNRQYVRGTNREPIGMTSGQYEPTCDFEMYKPQADFLRTTLAAASVVPGQGYMQVPFTITIATISPVLGVITDTIVAAYIVDEEAAYSEGMDALARKFTIMYQRLLYNGVTAVTYQLTGIGLVG